MHYDRSGAPIALTDSASAAHWDAMTAAFLAHGRSTPDHLAAVIAAEPELALPVAVKGLFCVMLGRREMTEAAVGAARDARRLMDAAADCPRTRHFLKALERWLAGNPPGAIAALEEQLTACPSDTLAAKIVHGMRFMIGDSAGMLRSVERVLPAHGADHPYRGYLLGCRAFALEETGTYAAAEPSGKDGLALARDDAWGLHAVAHVHDMTHRPDEGIALIEAHPESWEGCNNFRYHVWWHKALLHLDRGEIAVVLDLYDRRIRADQTDDYRDIANATSLLMRLELEGAAVGDRWDELAALAERRCEDGELIFADLHYMLALAGDNRPDAAARLTANVATTAQGSADQAYVMKDPGVAAAEGLAAFGDGQYDLAVSKLRAAQPKVQIMGGSHAQRDVFERVTIDAGLRAGRLDETAALVAERTALRNGAVDAFTDARMKMIARARALKPTVAAE